jgi:hypothetical protein
MMIPFKRRRPRLVEIATGEQSSLADAHRSDGKRFVPGADENLTAFLELESGHSYPASGWLHRIVRRLCGLVFMVLK